MKYLFEFTVSLLDGDEKILIEHREFTGENLEEVLEKLKLERMILEK